MAATATDQQHDRDTAVARSVLYGFLARGLAFPTAERLSELLGTIGPLASTVTEADPLLGPLVHEVVTAFEHPSEDLRRAHTAVFPPIESRDHPPYESAYVAGDVFAQTATMADVAGFYRAHGLRVGGREHQRPDHICVELEFMAFMARKEAVALEELGAEQVSECRSTQAAFLRDHLGRWGPPFGDRLAVAAGDAVYPRLGRLLRAWVDSDAALLGVEVEQDLDEPQPVPPPDDGSCGFDAPGCDTPGVTPVPPPTSRRRAGS